MTVTVLARSAGRDDNDDPIDPAGAGHQIEGCAVAPRVSATQRMDDGGEIHERGRDGVIVGLTLFAPPGADLLATDQVEIPGHDGVFAVEGEPGEWRSPFSRWTPGVQAALRRAKG